MLIKKILKISSIATFILAFMVGSVTLPFISKAGADSQIDFIKQAKQEGIGSYTQDLTISDSSKPVIFRIYVYNPTETTYTNGLLRDEFPFDQTGNVKNRAILSSDQTVSMYSDANISLPAGKKLIYRAGSTRVYGYQDSVGVAIPDVNGLSPLITPQGMKINKIDGGESIHKHWYVFYADMVDSSVPTPKPAVSMEMNKEVSNITQNTGFSESVNANAGDTLEYRIWVHDKVVGSEAQNVIVKDTLPTSEAQSFTNRAFVLGDNFSTLTDTAIVNTPFVGRLEYIPGTTRTFVHADNSAGVLVPDVNGQSELFTSSGVSLGNIKGCFEFERFITFEVKVVKPEVLPAPTQELPNTGPGDSLLLLLGTIPAGYAVRFLKRKI